MMNNEFEVKNEEELSKKIVMPLLEKMGYKEIRYVHGVDEFGRDILFCEFDKMDNKKWFSAQVKNVKIHGDVSKGDGNIQDIIRQIQSSFDNPFQDIKGNRYEYVKEVFLVTSKEITTNAKKQLMTNFEKKPLTIIDGIILREQINKYNPEHYEESTQLKLLLNKINNKNASLSPGDLERLFFLRDKFKLDKRQSNTLLNSLLNGELNFRRYHTINESKICLWFDELGPSLSSGIIIKKMNNLFNQFPYYSEYASESFTKNIFSLFSRIKRESSKTYKDLIISKKLNFKILMIKLSKSLIRMPDYRGDKILLNILEKEDILLDFIKNLDVINIQDERKLLILLSCEKYILANELLNKNPKLKEDFPKIIRKCFRDSIYWSEFNDWEFKYLKKIAEYIVNQEEELLKKLDPTVLFLCYSMSNEKQKAVRLLEKEETFNTIGDKELPEAYNILLKKKEDFLKMFKSVKKLPNKPLFLFELSEVFFNNKDYVSSLKYVEEALKRKKNLEYNWRIKWILMHKAEVLYKLHKYDKAYYIYRTLISQGEEIHNWQIYEECKKRMKTKKK